MSKTRVSLGELSEVLSKVIPIAVNAAQGIKVVVDINDETGAVSYNVWGSSGDWHNEGWTQVKEYTSDIIESIDWKNDLEDVVGQPAPPINFGDIEDIEPGERFYNMTRDDHDALTAKFFAAEKNYAVGVLTDGIQEVISNIVSEHSDKFYFA